MRRQSLESSLPTPLSRIAARNKEETEEASPMQVIFLVFLCMLLLLHQTDHQQSTLLTSNCLPLRMSGMIVSLHQHHVMHTFMMTGQ